MPLTTYSELQSAIALFLNRSDLTVAIRDFIALAEAQLQRDVRHWRMQVADKVTMATRYSALPADWVETIRLTVPTSGAKPLRLVSLADMEERRAAATDAAGTPEMYALTAGQIEVFPTPSSSLAADIIYYRTIPSLSGSLQNWLLTEAPDAYLYGSLIQSAPFLSEDSRAGVWGAFYGAAVARLNETSDAAKWSGTGLRMMGRNNG